MFELIKNISAGVGYGLFLKGHISIRIPPYYPVHISPSRGLHFFKSELFLSNIVA